MCNTVQASWYSIVFMVSEFREESVSQTCQHLFFCVMVALDGAGWVGIVELGRAFIWVVEFTTLKPCSMCRTVFKV